MGLLDAPGWTPNANEIILLAAGQSNMAGWTAPDRISTAEAGDERIRVFDIGKGDNLISNGDFFDGATGWTLSGFTGASTGGVLTLTATAASFPNMIRTITGLTVGTTYELTGWVEPVSADAQFRLGTSNPTLIGGTRYTSQDVRGTGVAQAMSTRWTATATSHTVELISNSGTTPTGTVFARLRDFQLREVLSSGTSYPVAAEPIFNQIDFANIGALGPCPAYHIAKSLLTAGKASRVTIVPTAIGGTALVGGPWASPSGARYTDTVTKLTAALADNPVAVPVMFWIQGEADATNLRTKQQYQTAFQSMLAGFRGVAGASKMRCVIGSIVPEYIASSAAHGRIDGAHQELARTDWGVYYVRAPLGYQKSGEQFHFNAAGARAMAPGLAAVVRADWAR